MPPLLTPMMAELKSSPCQCETTSEHSYRKLPDYRTTEQFDGPVFATTVAPLGAVVDGMVRHAASPVTSMYSVTVTRPKA